MNASRVMLSSALSLGLSASAFANCPVNHAQLRSALVAATSTETSGLNLQMWGTVVNRDGIVCAVAFTGSDRGAQWPGSRVISAQKANTANAFSLDGLALSTANLYGPVQGTSQATPLGGSLYGLQFSNPVDTTVAYGGNPALYGQARDPMVGRRIGGVNVFGGGLALYDASGKVVGAIGVSGDTSCADHHIAWRARNNLTLDFVPGGVSGDLQRPDNIIYDFPKLDTGRVDRDGNPIFSYGNENGVTDGFEQPTCIETANERTLPVVRVVPAPTP